MVRLNSIPPGSNSAYVQSVQLRPLYGRWKCASQGRPSEGVATQTIGWFPMKARVPPGRNNRTASGIQRSGSHQIAAPYSETAKSKSDASSGTLSALASMKAISAPCCLARRRAVASCSAEMSMAVTLAPRRVIHPETYAVPQPSSMAFIPVMSAGSRLRDSSVSPQNPQLGGEFHCRSPISTQCRATLFQ